MRVLVIEDNPDIVANLHQYLEPLGYELDSARTGKAGLGFLRDYPYDVIVLDLMLPGMDGLQVCQELRTSLRLRTPLLMLTARDTIPDKVAGFEAGADDYLVKPFSLVELDVRLKALARRGPSLAADAVLRFGELELDPGTHEARRAGQLLRLTPTGYLLLFALLRSAPEVVTREQLEHEVWRDDRPDSDALRTHIHALRQVLDKPFASPMLRTLPGVGFRLVATHEA
ncbi:response regulator transcription factor [Ramlibacter monticola]|uniref:Response regulator transcription factor n=1 Tax=Ramlibacter monticola TaxID=1926872 RepID=A0A937CU23_9BURK|nr:response regulator transcription factor [Ramlibacter monticola]MBL0392911.1 response regulator transcription factor [Ramlibacter monticola]